MARDLRGWSLTRPPLARGISSVPASGTFGIKALPIQLLFAKHVCVDLLLEAAKAIERAARGTRVELFLAVWVLDSLVGLAVRILVWSLPRGWASELF